MTISVTQERRIKLGNAWLWVGDIVFDDSYPTNGESVDGLIPIANIADVWFASGNKGYLFEYVHSTKKVKVYRPTGAISNHTHAVALDGGVSAAEAAHTHAVALDSGVSGAEAAHTHAAGALSGATAAEEAHTHAVALDGGASGAGDAHTHGFTGTAKKPWLIQEEAVAVSSHTGTLAYVPLYIVAVQVTAGGVTGAFKVIPVGETPHTTEVAVNFTTGGLTFLDTDAVTAVKITYLPKRASGHLSSVTVDEVVVASASKVNLAARAGLVQYIWNDTANALLVPEPSGEAPTAATNCVLDINDSENTSIDTDAAINGVNLKVTYVPYSQIPAACFIDDTDVALNSEAWDFTNDTGAGYRALVIPGFGVYCVGESAGANELAIWEGPSGGAGTDGVAVWTPNKNQILTNQTAAMLTTAISWLLLDLLQFIDETPAGSNANESTHTHGPGTLADAASGAGSSHSHAVGTLAGAATGAGSSHTHGPGTLADAASGAGSSHTHGPGTLADTASGTGGASSAAAANEVGSGESLAALTGVRMIAIGY